MASKWPSLILALESDVILISISSGCCSEAICPPSFPDNIIIFISLSCAACIAWIMLAQFPSSVSATKVSFE